MLQSSESRGRTTLLFSTPRPPLPADLFELGNRTYLLVVDYYSRFVEKLSGTTATEVINHTKGIFARHGIPEIVISDNGPQYTSAAYAQLAKEYGFSHVTRKWRGGTGSEDGEEPTEEARRSVPSSTCTQSHPLQCGYSPSELLMARKLHTTVPTTRKCLAPGIPDSDRVRERQPTEIQTGAEPQRPPQGSHPSPLKPGSRVWVPDRNSEAEVVELHNPRSYLVQTPAERARTYQRNRRALRPLPARGAGDEEPTQENLRQLRIAKWMESHHNCFQRPRATPQPAGQTRQSGRQRRPPDRLDPSWA